MILLQMEYWREHLTLIDLLKDLSISGENKRGKMKKVGHVATWSHNWLETKAVYIWALLDIGRYNFWVCWKENFSNKKFAEDWKQDEKCIFLNFMGRMT